MKLSSSVYLYPLLFFTTISVILVQQFVELDNELEVYGWERDKSRNVSNYVPSSENSAIIVPKDMCEDSFLRIFVVSDVKNFERRAIIRETWGNEMKFGYHTFKKIHRATNYLNISEPIDSFRYRITFVLGKRTSTKLQEKVRQEAEMYNDILQEDFIEHYSNLTLKSLFILKWASNACYGNSSKYFAKVDDDIFINVPNLIHILKGGTVPTYNALKYFYNDRTIDVMNPHNRLKGDKGLLMGDIWNLTPSLRNSHMKHYAPRYLYEPAFYPPFLSGYTFVMSSDVAKILYKKALDTPIFHLEDVFLTGIVAQKAKIRRKGSNLFSFNRLQDVCGLRGIIAENGRDPEEFFTTLEYVLEDTIKCETMKSRWVIYLYKIIYNIFEPWISIWNNYKYWFPPKN